MNQATQATNGKTEATFEGWCIVELFGHQQIAGKVSEKSMFGTALMRIDVPATSKRLAFTKFYGGGAIYAITPVEQAIAEAMAEGLNEAPIQEWRMKVIEPSRQLPSPDPGEFDHPDWPDASTWDDDDDGNDDEESELEQALKTVDPDSETAWDDAAKIVADYIEQAALQEHEADAAKWAEDLLKSQFVIFDTETTGFESDDEIIQIGVIDQDGNTVLETLIKPAKPITNSQYHGITDEMVKDAPAFPEVYEQIKSALEGKTVIAYNFAYDRRMLNQVCSKHDVEIIEFGGQACAMEQYAEFNGEWDDYHGNYRWKKLREALAAFGLKHEDFGVKEHDACTDARATLAVIKKMAESVTVGTDG